MIIGRILLDGEILNPDDLSGAVKLRSGLSKDWLIENSDLTLKIYDPDRLIFNRLLMAATPVLRVEDEHGAAIFEGPVQVQQCRWTEKDHGLSIMAQDPFATAKSTELDPLLWERPRDTAYTVMNADPDAEDVDELTFDHTADLWPGDEIQITRVDDDRESTEKAVIRHVAPEFGTVRLEKVLRTKPKDGDAWTRANHEKRFIPVSEALDTMAQQIGPVITSQVSEVVFDDSATWPYPPPRGSVPGSVVLRGAVDADKVMAIYANNSDNDTSRAMVSLDFDGNTELWTWYHAGPQAKASPYPIDWVRHLDQPPAALLPPLHAHIQTGGRFVPRLLLNMDEATTGLELPSGMTFTDVDLIRAEAWELIDQEGYQLIRHTWDGTDWSNPQPIKEFPGLRLVKALAYDHGADRFIMARVENGLKMETIDRDGNRLPISIDWPVIRFHSLGVIATHRLIYGLSTDGRRLYLADADSFEPRGVLEVTDGVFHPHTLTPLDDAWFVIVTGTAGTVLQRWELITGVWRLTLADTLLDYAAQHPVTTRAGGFIWIGANGRLWVHGKRYRPMLARADVAGMSVQDLLRSLVFLSHGVMHVDHTGLAVILPRAARFGAVEKPVLPGPITLHPQWDRRFQRVTVTGRDDITATAGTGVPGPELEIENPYIETQSHALAMARLILDWHKQDRIEARVTVVDTPITPPAEIDLDTGRFLVQSVDTSLVFRATSGRAPYIRRSLTLLEVDS